MFESLKKKFSKTSDQLEEELKTEAEQENNISEENEENVKKKSFFSFGRKNNKEKDNTDDEIADEELSLTSKEENSESINDEIVDSIDEEENEEELAEEDIFEPVEEQTPAKEKKSRFWSRSKDKSDNEEEIAEDDNSESFDQEPQGDKKSSFWNKSKDESDEEEEDLDSSEDEDEKKSRFWSRSKDKSDEEEEDLDSSEDEDGSGFFSFIREKTISEKHVDDLLWDLEMGLLEGDVAMEVASEVVDSVKNDLVGKKIKRSNDITEYTFNALRDAVAEIIDIDGKSMTEMIEEKKVQGEPLVVMFVGINGTGKTTTIGKLANFYLKKGYTPVIAASDTFRAGAIEQVTHHADNVGVKIIKHQKGSDPAAVAFDAVEHAKAQGKELVLIDTAGRMQTNTNLMDEMKKIKRVAKPDLVVFVGDALTGNDATEQARKFNDAIDIDGVILTKADADSKGGASLSIGYVIQKPIMFLGIGQGYEDIMEYDAEWMLDQLFSDDEDLVEAE